MSVKNREGARIKTSVCLVSTVCGCEWLLLFYLFMSFSES